MKLLKVIIYDVNNYNRKNAWNLVLCSYKRLPNVRLKRLEHVTLYSDSNLTQPIEIFVQHGRNLNPENCVHEASLLATLENIYQIK